MSIVKEIAAQCSKQKGVVIINTLQESEKRDKLVANLTPIVKTVTNRLRTLSLCGKNDTIKPIIYNSNAIFRNQHIRIFSETPTTQPVKEITYIIIFFTLNHIDDTINLSNESRIISSFQWNDANVLDNNYRAFLMDDLFKIIIDHSVVNQPSSLKSSSVLPSTPNSSYDDLRRKQSISVDTESVEAMVISSPRTSSSFDDNTMIMDQSRSSNGDTDNATRYRSLASSSEITTIRWEPFKISFSDASFVSLISNSVDGQPKRASNSRYSQLLLDYVFSSQFKDIDIYDEYVKFLTWNPWYSHCRSVIGFLYDMIIHTKNDHTKMKKILDMVIETELFINMKSVDRDGDNVLVLYQFVYEIEAIRPVWYDHYRISPKLNQFWIEVSENHYRVKADWLLKFQNLQNRRLPIINGFIDLTGNEFRHLFLPAFYRSLLADLCNYIIFIEAYHTDYMEEIFAVELMDKEIDREDMYDFFGTFPSTSHSLADYYDFSIAFGYSTQTSEQVSIKLSTQSYYRDLYSSDNKNNTSSASLTYQQATQDFDRSQMPDLEDLLNPKSNYLPRCLSDLMIVNGEKRKKMQHYDRLNVATYLGDMSYGKDEIVAAFPDDAKAIESNYETYVRKRARDGNKKFNTFYCTAIMNKPLNDHDHCRCPYINQQPTRRTQYGKNISSSSSSNITNMSDNQVTTYKKYRNNCFSNIISNGSFSHPLNYVAIQVNKNL